MHKLLHRGYDEDERASLIALAVGIGEVVRHHDVARGVLDTPALAEESAADDGPQWVLARRSELRPSAASPVVPDSGIAWLVRGPDGIWRMEVV